MDTRVWKTLLALQETMRLHREPSGSLTFSALDPSSLCQEGRSGGPGPIVHLVFGAGEAPSAPETEAVCRVGDTPLDLRWVQPGHLSPEIREMLDRYLPYCLLPHFAHRLGRTIAVAHFAQSLDGRIATRTGDSRWIGNEGNLEHAHRMRSLCDGILIGKRTLQLDQPQLTVRRVEGPDPVRVVLGSRIEDCSCLLQAGPASVLVFHKQATDLPQPQVDQVVHPCEQHIPTRVVLDALYRRGLCSVLIEGGAQTTSAFIQEETLDILQLHIAPILIGSGRNSIQLPEIMRIDHAVEFSHFHFQRIANTYMFTGQLRTGGNLNAFVP